MNAPDPKENKGACLMIIRLKIELRNVDDDRILKRIHNWSKRRDVKLSNCLNVSDLIQKIHLPMGTVMNAFKY